MNAFLVDAIVGVGAYLGILLLLHRFLKPKFPLPGAAPTAGECAIEGVIVGADACFIGPVSKAECWCFNLAHRGIFTEPPVLAVGAGSLDVRVAGGEVVRVCFDSKIGVGNHRRSGTVTRPVVSAVGELERTADIHGWVCETSGRIGDPLYAFGRFVPLSPDDPMRGRTPATHVATWSIEPGSRGTLVYAGRRRDFGWRGNRYRITYLLALVCWSLPYAVYVLLRYA